MLVLPLLIYRTTTEINWPVASVGGLVLLIFALVIVAAFQPPLEIRRGVK